MGAIAPTHLILLLIVVLIVFGPGRLPEIGEALGRGLREFRQAAGGGLEDTMRSDEGAEQPPTDAQAK